MLTVSWVSHDAAGSVGWYEPVLEVKQERKSCFWTDLELLSCSSLSPLVFTKLDQVFLVS